MAEALIKPQNCVQTLNILMMKEGITPVYELVDQVVGTNNCLFTYRLVFGELEVCGSGSSKKLARHTAAEAMLQKLGEIDRKGQNDGESEAVNRLRSYAIDILRAIGQKFYSAQPFYEEIEESGPVHMRKFTYECTFINYKIRSTHRKKKTAKADSALKMIMLLGEKYPEIAEFFEKQRNIICSNKYTIEPSENKRMAIDLQSGVVDTVDRSKNHNSMSNEEHRASSSSNGNFEVNCQPENTVRMDSVSERRFSLIQRHVVLKKIDNFFAICERMDQADYNKLDNETDLSKQFDQIMNIMHIEYEEYVHKTFDGNFITSIYLMRCVKSAVNCDIEYSRATAYYYALHFLKELLGSRS